MHENKKEVKKSFEPEEGLLWKCEGKSAKVET